MKLIRSNVGQQTNLPPGADFSSRPAPGPASKLLAILLADYWQNYQVGKEKCPAGLDTDNPVLDGILH